MFGRDEDPILGTGIFFDVACTLHIQGFSLNIAPFHDDNPRMLGSPDGAWDVLGLWDLPVHSQAQSAFEKSRKIATAHNSHIYLAGGHSEPIIFALVPSYLC